MNEQVKKIKQEAIENASHGEFFFAKWTTSDGYVRESPCLVISNHQDPHNEIIVLKCTTQPKKTDFDILVSGLRKPTMVRTNKIYTINRNQLLFPIYKEWNATEYSEVITKLKEAQKIE